MTPRSTRCVRTRRITPRTRRTLNDPRSRTCSSRTAPRAPPARPAAKASTSLPSPRAPSVTAVTAVTATSTTTTTTISRRSPRTTRGRVPCRTGASIPPRGTNPRAPKPPSRSGAPRLAPSAPGRFPSRWSTPPRGTSERACSPSPFARRPGRCRSCDRNGWTLRQSRGRRDTSRERRRRRRCRRGFPPFRTRAGGRGIPRRNVPRTPRRR
mmetsp:Transcript_12824/g.50109  ORF Transcript_12824/g.50109 Transcript_12824/m.50109 type:complete len:211 (+) Transcript_12824:1297-1929(+)